MLFALLNSYHQEIEYDWDVRGWDLIDFWRGKVTIRKATVRLLGILRDRTSSTARAVFPHETAWGETEHVIATVMDMYLMTKFGKEAPRMTRPGDKERAESLLEERKRRWKNRQRRGNTRG